MSDKPTTWDTIEAERAAVLDRRAAVISAMRAAGHDPDYNVATRYVDCLRMRRDGEAVACCAARVDPELLADADLAKGWLDRIRGMTCRLAGDLFEDRLNSPVIWTPKTRTPRG